MNSSRSSNVKSYWLSAVARRKKYRRRRKHLIFYLDFHQMKPKSLEHHFHFHLLSFIVCMRWRWRLNKADEFLLDRSRIEKRGNHKTNRDNVNPQRDGWLLLSLAGNERWRKHLAEGWRAGIYSFLLLLLLFVWQSPPIHRRFSLSATSSSSLARQLLAFDVVCARASNHNVRPKQCLTACLPGACSLALMMLGYAQGTMARHMSLC